MVIAPPRSFPPLWRTLGASPIQLTSFSGPENLFMSPISVRMRRAVLVVHSGYGHEEPDVLVVRGLEGYP
ncbi:MAG: hypothetical protein ACTSWF_09255, partial [Candidatus Freyarchaeota archaeon]